MIQRNKPANYQFNFFIMNYTYPLLIVLFMIDMGCFALLEAHATYTILAVFILKLTKHQSPSLLFVLGCLLGLESFMITGNMITHFIYLIPMSIGVLYTNHLVYNSRWYPLAVFCAFLLVHVLLLQGLWLGQWSGGLYTAKVLLGNIILMTVLSLKY